MIAMQNKQQVLIMAVGKQEQPFKVLRTSSGVWGCEKVERPHGGLVTVFLITMNDNNKKEILIGCLGK